MIKNEWKKWVGVVGRILVAYALVFAQGAWAGQNQATKDKAASPQNAAAQQANEKQPALATTPVAQSKQVQGEEAQSSVADEKPSRDGSHEGIKVHGHWTIEVRNPDGMLVTHREFENSLVQNNPLSSFLSRTYSVGRWFVDLFGGVCEDSFFHVAIDCHLVEPGLGGSGNSSTLTISSSGNSFILSGTASAQFNGSITGVRTSAGGCPPATPPSSPCDESAGIGISGAAFFIFTSATLSAPLPVSAGQTIAVTVNISFS